MFKKHRSLFKSRVRVHQEDFGSEQGRVRVLTTFRTGFWFGEGVNPLQRHRPSGSFSPDETLGRGSGEGLHTREKGREGRTSNGTGSEFGDRSFGIGYGDGYRLLKSDRTRSKKSAVSFAWHVLNG